MTGDADVVVAGAGPAGCIAAIVLARAGARVRLLDRACFPRDKLCGDTLNPGTLAVLRRLNIRAADAGLPIAGMLVTGPAGARVTSRYPPGFLGRSIGRRQLDMALFQLAADAGAMVEQGVVVQHPIVESCGGAGQGCRVAGVTVCSRRGGVRRLQSRLVVAADGRASRIARHLGLSRHPRRPRRWAVGAYFTGVADLTSLGEMHVRANHYIGVAPLPGGLANACVVSADRRALANPRRLLTDALNGDPELSDRFHSARMVTDGAILGPLAVECDMPGMPGLLLAGDAAGFIDPMTGDGLRFALRGAELAAVEGLRALETGAGGAHLRLAAARGREFAAKWRFNRVLRRLVGSPRALGAAGYLSRHSSWPVSRVIAFAGDLGVA